MGNVFTDMFSSNVKGEGFEAIPQTESQRAAETKLIDLGTRPINFPRAGVAPLSDIETAGLNELRKLITTGGGGDIDLSQDVLRSIVTAPSNPLADPRFEAFQQFSRDEEARTIGSARRGAQKGGVFKGSQNLAVEGKTRARFSGERMSVLGDIIQQGIDRKLIASTQLNRQAVDTPLKMVQAAMSAGATPRMIEQLLEDAEFQQKISTLMFPFSTQAPILSNILNKEAFAWNPGTTDPPIFSQIAPVIAAAMLGGMGGGGGAGGFSAGGTGGVSSFGGGPTGGFTSVPV